MKNVEFENTTREETEITKVWNDLQTKFYCCGVDSYTDWNITDSGKTCIKYSLCISKKMKI